MGELDQIWPMECEAVFQQLSTVNNDLLAGAALTFQLHTVPFDKQRIDSGILLESVEEQNRICSVLEEITDHIRVVDAAEADAETLLTGGEGAAHDGIVAETPELVVIKNAGFLSGLEQELLENTLQADFSAYGFEQAGDSSRGTFDSQGSVAAFFVPPYLASRSQYESTSREPLYSPDLFAQLDFVVPSQPIDASDRMGLDSFPGIAGLDDPIETDEPELPSWSEYAETEADLSAKILSRCLEEARQPSDHPFFTCPESAKEVIEKVATGIACANEERTVTDEHVSSAWVILREICRRHGYYSDAAFQRVFSRS